MDNTLYDAVFLLLGTVIGNLRGKRVGRRSAKPEEGVCQCKHKLAFHSKEGCHANVDVSQYNSIGEHVGYKQKQCACVRYVDPSTSYVPELDG